MSFYYVEVYLKDKKVVGYMEANSYYIAYDYLEYKFPEYTTLFVEAFEYNKHGRLDDYLPVA